MRTKTIDQSEKILNVAVRLFATHRFHEARMEDISAAAGVGKGTLYRYFKDKEELYLALLERSAHQYAERMTQALANASTLREKLDAIAATALDYFDEQPYVFDLIQHAEALQRPDQPFPWKQTRAVSLELTKEVIIEGQKAGVFRPGDPAIAALMFLGGIRAIIRFGDMPRPADLVKEMVDGLLDGLNMVPGPCKPESASNGRRAKVSFN